MKQKQVLFYISLHSPNLPLEVLIILVNIASIQALFDLALITTSFQFTFLDIITFQSPAFSYFFHHFHISSDILCLLPQHQLSSTRLPQLLQEGFPLLHDNLLVLPMDDLVSTTTTTTPNPTSTTTTTVPKPSALSLPWVEKYRPQLLSDVVGNEDSIKKLRAIAQQGNLPNLIITGPPGTGKTTSVLALAREMLGTSYKQAVLELNASDARGIDAVRNEIKTFAQLKVTLPPGLHKIVILDEVDSMTKGAQQSLRRIMEIYSNTTRFALACNISSKIIEPIQSRCAILRFSKLNDNELRDRLQVVLKNENISNYEESGLKALLFTAQGDMRQALNNLQSTWSSFQSITAETVYKVVDQPHPDKIHACLKYCANHELRNAIEVLQVLYKQGYSAQDLLGTIFTVCKYADISEHKRLEFIKQIAQAQLRLAEGCESFLQLTSLLAKMCIISDDIVADTMNPIALAGK